MIEEGQGWAPKRAHILSGNIAISAYKERKGKKRYYHSMIRLYMVNARNINGYIGFAPARNEKGKERGTRLQWGLSLQP
eukprot:571755-Pelagomonas_calceolata.AAC.1